MKKYQVVKKAMEFDNIIKNGKVLKNKYYIIYYKESCFPYSRFGLAIGKKMGKAIVRNKIKRQIRMIINNHKNLFKIGYDYIIISKRSLLDLNYQEMDMELVNLIKKGD